jgi:small multidrug resistance pump
MTTWLLLLGAIASEVTGSLFLKSALDHPALYAPVLIGFVTSFVFLSAVLRRGMALGVAYGVWGALGVASTSSLSAVIYDEPFTPVMGVGLAMIIGGVLVVEIGSQAARKQTRSLRNAA